MYNPGQSVRLKGSARTNTGKVRDNNEDNVHLWTQDGNIALAVVADGMGGAVAGEEASRMAIEAIQTGLMAISDKLSTHNQATIEQTDLADYLQAIIREANDYIVTQSNEHPELKGMGTTVTLAIIRNMQVVIGHVGDSRAYLVEGDTGNIEQITSDHSFVQALVAAGHITADEAEEHPMRNVLYRALGQTMDVDVDIYHENLRVGDRLVLCSDGLTLHLKPGEIAQLALAMEEPSDCSQQMIDLANQRGGRDNVSVIIIKVEEHTTATAALKVESLTEPPPDEEDTLVLQESPGFGSSESSTNTPSEFADQNHNDREARLAAKVITLEQLMVHEEDEGESFGEGTDSQTPD